MFTASISRETKSLLMLGLLAVMPDTFADEKTFTVGGSAVVLSDVSAQVGLRFTGMRFSPNDNGWLVDVSLTNKSSSLVPTPLVMWVENYSGTTGPIGPDGTEGSNPPHAYYDYTAQTLDALLWPGEKTQSRTLLLGYNSGAPTVVGRVYAKLSALPPGVTLVRTLNELGQPLPGVQISETGPLGNTSTASDKVFGLATLGQTNGAHSWRFSLADYLPIWRRAILAPGEVSLAFSPRLTRRVAGVSVPIAGGSVTTPTVRLTVPPGAFAQQTTINLTPLTAQTLPANLPLGWSPLQAFWLEAPAEPLSPLSATVSLWGSLYGGETAALAWWNSSSVVWEVVQTLAGPISNSIVSLPKTGAFVVVVPDNGTWAPPSAVVGEPLVSVSLPTPSYVGLSATGSVNPSISIASRLPEHVTGQARVTVTSGVGALPSGLSLFNTIRESYALNDDTFRRSPSYENFVAGYQRPGDVLSNTLEITFPMRPLLLFGSETLAEATIEADLLPPGDYGLRVLGPSGGQASAGGISLRATPGVFARREALYIRPLAADDLALFSFSSVSNATVVAGFDLGISGIATGSKLDLQITGLATNSLFVLARVIMQEGFFGLEPIQRLASNGQGTLSSLEPSNGERLPGITSAGQFALVRVSSPQGLITGIARNATGQAAAGLPVRVEGQPWLALSASGGLFRLVAPGGAALVSVTDPFTGDRGQVTANITAPTVPASANPSVLASGPRVLAVSPTNAAPNVPRVTPVTVQFSEAINPATLGTNGVQLFGTNGQLVAVSLTLNLQHTVATLLPVAQMAANTLHVIRVSTNITDTTGIRLEGPNQFSFITQNDALNRLAAQLTSYEPVNGTALIVGSPGTAEPESAVILVNQTSGQTATIVSKPDGSFSNSIPADVDDFLSAALVNRNGTRNEIPVSRQLFRDGRVGLFNGGGVVEAQSDGGPVQVIVQPGSIPNKTIFKIEALNMAQMLTLVGNARPENGKVLGGFRYVQSGDFLKESPDIAFPIAAQDLGLPPGVSPSEATFALAIPRSVAGGTAYEVVDKMEYENGRLVTHSYPFEGLVALGGALLQPQYAVYLYVGSGLPTVLSGRVLAGEVDSSGGLVNEATARRVGGATVMARGVGSVISEPGHLPSGTVFATSKSPTGSYVLVVPASVQGYVFPVAQHPEFSTVGRGTSVLLSPLFKAAVRDVVFPLVAPGEVPDTIPPTLSIAHSPANPTTNDVVQIIVQSSDNRDPPVITVSLASKVSLLSEIPDDQVQLSLGTDEPPTHPNATATRKTVSFTTGSPAEITFKCSATDQHFNVEDTYTIFVGATRTNGTAGVANPDKNDDVPPYVVWAYPPEGSSSLAPGESIRLRFSEAISDSVLKESISLKTGSKTLQAYSLALSADQTELSLIFTNLEAGTDYSLELGTKVIDLIGNELDQNPKDDDDNPTTLNPADPFKLNFRTAPLRKPASFADLEAGGGIVSKGGYAYVLERKGDLDGAVLVYDLADPRSMVAAISVPGYPRDLKLIPQYAFKRRPDTAPQTNDLLAVVGGVVGRTFGQYLWIIDISDPLHPKRLAGTATSPSTQTAVIKVDWNPPVLSFLEIGPQCSVNIVNLQRFIYGLNLTPEEYRAYSSSDAEAIAGVDNNLDGDYVDADVGDTLPMPERTPIRFVGWEKGYAADDTDQSIIDYSVQDRGNYVGVLLRAGSVLDGQGKPSAIKTDVAYRTLHFGEQELEREESSFIFTEPEFNDANLKRLTTLFDVSLTVTNVTTGTNEVKILNLAIVSLTRTASDGTIEPLIVVLDITDPKAPARLSTISLPAGETPYSITQREDGKLILALRNSLMILDPTGFGMISPDQLASSHPSVLGSVPGIGSTHYAFFASASGLIGVADGRVNQIVQIAPRLSFVAMDGVSPFNPKDKVGLSDETVAKLLSKASSVDALRLSRYREQRNSGGTVILKSDVNNFNPKTHFYVLVHAPGSAGDTIELAIESLNWAGAPLDKKGVLFPPVHALSATALAGIHQTPGTDDVIPRTATAWRLSTNAASEFYNYYLSRPLVVIDEEISASELDVVRNPTAADGVAREVLWSGHNLRAFLDPSIAGSSVHDFAAVIDDRAKAIKPGVQALVAALPGDYLMGPNPAPVRGGGAIGTALGVIQGHNSELAYSTVDLALPGRRMPLVFRRTYKGQDLYGGPFGRGWEFNYHQRLIEVTEALVGSDGQLPQYIRYVFEDAEVAKAGDLLFLNGDGRNLVYKGVVAPSEADVPAEIKADPLYDDYKAYGPTVFYLPQKGIFNYFVKFNNGLFLRLDPDGTLNWFNIFGRLVKIEDRFKNKLKFLYDARGALNLVKDELDREVQIGYYRAKDDPDFRTGVDAEAPNDASLRKICRILDYSGRDLTYHYDANGLLEQFKGPQVSVTPSGPPSGFTSSFTGRRISQYTYSGTGDPSKSARSLIQVQFLSDTPGIAETESFLLVKKQGNKGRDTVQQIDFGSGESVTIDQSFQNTTTGLSDAAEPVVTTAKAVDGKIETTKHKLDSKGRLKQIERKSLTSGTSLITLQDFDTDTGLLIRTTLPERNSVEYLYDTNNPSLRSRGNLVEIRRIADAVRGGGTLTATFTNEAHYQLPSGTSKDFNGNTITTTWDANFLEKKVEFGSPKVAETAMTLNSHGQISVFVNTDGVRSERKYVEATGFPDKIIEGTGSNPPTTSYSYGSGTMAQARGLPASITSPTAATTALTYNERDQVVQCEQDGAVIQHAYDLHGRQAGQAVKINNTTWIVESTGYDQFGFRTNQIVQNVEVDGSPVPLETKYSATSGDHSRPQQIILPNGETHTLTYDDYGRLQEIRISGTSPDYIETYGYDGNGNRTNVVIGEVIGDHSSASSYFDGHDRLSKVVSPSGLIQQTLYDGNGNVRTNISFKADGQTKLAQVRMEYDALNRSVSTYHLRGHVVETETAVEKRDYFTIAPTLRADITDSLGGVTKHAYDDAGRSDFLVTPTSQTVNSYYATAPGLLQTRRTDYLDPVSHYLEDTLTYNGRAQVTSHKDSLNQLTSFLNLSFDGRIPEVMDAESTSTSFGYTLLGEVASQTNANSVTRSYTYDKKRNPAATTPEAGGGIKNEYDSSGRLVSTSLPNEKPTSSTLFTSFNYLNLPSIIYHPRGVQEQLSYDAAGRLDFRQVTLPGQTSRQEDFDYDELDRPTLLSVPEGTAEFEYDPLGYPFLITFNYAFMSDPLRLTQEVNDLLQRTNFVYPPGTQILTYQRETTGTKSGRLTGLTVSSGDAIVTQGSVSYAADALPAAMTFGNNAIKLSVTYDEVLRPTKLRYERPDHTTLVEVRYNYSATGMQRARQFVHRNGRADIFGYDPGYRLTDTQMGARPDLGSEDGATDITGWSDWKPGYFARVYAYATNSDLLASAAVRVMPSSRAPPFAETYLLSPNADEVAFQVPHIDGADRQIDEAGNVTLTELLVRVPTNSEPVRVLATNSYDGLNRLALIQRNDGVTISNTYGPTGLRIRRTVAGPATLCVPSDIAYVYDGDLLIEEYDLTVATPPLISRYYYTDGQDSPVAGDFWNFATSRYDRYYFLKDVQGSVLAVADAIGQIKERIIYDAWGQPTIEQVDTVKPRLASASWSGNDLVFVFSEPSLPPLASSSSDTLITSYANNLSDAFAFTDANGVLSPSAYVYDEGSGTEFGTVVRVTFNPANVHGNLSFALNANKLTDEWGNYNDALVSFNMGQPSGARNYTGSVVSTAPTILARSSINSPFLFHGQVFDYDTGLVYLRARYYDPFAGLFLQPDPYGFEDSANLYSAFANNPVNLRDPTGAHIGAVGEYFDDLEQKATDGLIGSTYKGGSIGGAATAFWGLQFAKIVTDTLRIGEGIHKGTFGGFVEDGMRLLAIWGSAESALTRRGVGSVEIANPAAKTSAASELLERIDPASKRLIQQLAKKRQLWPKQSTTPSVQDIIDGLRGVTQISDRIKDKVIRGEIKVHLDSGVMFNLKWIRANLRARAFPGLAPQAFQQSGEIFLRRTSKTLLVDAVHEGTHALDWLDFINGRLYRPTQWGSEFRAYRAEQNFLQQLGQPQELRTLEEIDLHIRAHYDNLDLYGERALVNPW